MAVGVAEDILDPVDAEFLLPYWPFTLVSYRTGGRVSQTGTRAQLMALGGKYRSMVEQQIHMTLGSLAPAGVSAGELA